MGVGQLGGLGGADHQRAVGPALLQRGVAPDMVAVAVRVEDSGRLELLGIQVFEDPLRL